MKNGVVQRKNERWTNDLDCFKETIVFFFTERSLSRDTRDQYTALLLAEVLVT